MKTSTTTRFKKSVEKCINRGYDIKRLQVLIDLLAENKKLDLRYKAHRLSGKWSGYWECHIEQDWLLVYTINEEILLLVDTGTHSDLFK